MLSGSNGARGRSDMNQFEYTVADHTELGCVSIISQEPVMMELELYYLPTEHRVSVRVLEDGFVNMGDMAQKCTGRYYRSARHRVLANKEKHRHSVAFFLDENLKLVAEAVDGPGVEIVVGYQVAAS